MPLEPTPSAFAEIGSLYHRFAATIEGLGPMPPDLHVIIAEAPGHNHPRLSQGDLVALLSRIRPTLLDKHPVRSFLIPSTPANKLSYLGDERLLPRFRELCCEAARVLRRHDRDLDESFKSATVDFESLVAPNAWPSLMANILTSCGMDLCARWRWPDDHAVRVVPYDAAGLAEWNKHEQAQGIPAWPDPPKDVNVTVFGLDVFSASAMALFALNQEITEHLGLESTGRAEPIPPDQPQTSRAVSRAEISANSITLDDRAVSLLTRWLKDDRSKITKRALARALGCHHSSLNNCPTFKKLWEVSTATPMRGYRDGSTGNIEVGEDD